MNKQHKLALHIQHHITALACCVMFLLLNFCIPFPQGGWEHITVRGNATEASRGAVPDTTEENPAASKEGEDEENKGKTEHSKTPLMVSESQELDRNSVSC